MLPRPSPGTCKQRGHNRVRRIQASRQIRNRHAHFHWVAIPRASDMHETHFRLDHHIVPSTVAVWSRLTVPSDTGVDQPGINGSQCFIIHAVFLETSREVVLHQDITLLDELV